MVKRSSIYTIRQLGTISIHLLGNFLCNSAQNALYSSVPYNLQQIIAYYALTEIGLKPHLILLILLFL